MEKIKIMSLLLVVVLIIGVTLAGCTAAAPASDENQQENSSESATTDDVKEPVTLKFTYWGSPIEKQAIEDNLKKFEENYGYITVDAQYIPNEDYLTKLTAMIAGDDEPDLGYLLAANAFQWAEEGELANINEFLEDDPDINREDYLEEVWYNWSDTESLGTNTACEAIAMYYNKDLTDKAGIQVPATAEEAWTWDEFVEAAQKLTIDSNGNNALDPGFDAGSITQYGVQLGTGWYFYMPMVYSNGGDYINEDGTEFTLDDPAAVEAIQRVADLMNVYHVAPSPAQVTSMPSAVVGLQSEQVAMMIDGQWNLLDLGNAGFNFGIGVLPKMKESVTLILGGPTVIFKSTEHPQEAWLLYKWLGNPESSIDLQAGGLWMPLLKSWYEDPELIQKWATGNPAHPDEYKTAVMEQTLKNGVPGCEYYVKNFANVDEIVSVALEQVWYGEKTAQEAMDDIADDVEKLLEGRY